MYDREHHLEQTLLMNSEEGVIVIDQSIPVNDSLMNMAHVPHLPINVDVNVDVMNESNDILPSTVINDVAISTDILQLRQPIGPSGMIEELLSQVPVEEELPSTMVNEVANNINNIESIQPTTPSDMLEELFSNTADVEEIVIIEPNLSVPQTQADKELRLANLATILNALLLEQSNLMNSVPTVTDAATPVRTGHVNQTIQPVEYDEENDSKPAAITTPNTNTNESNIIITTQENDTEENDSKPAAIITPNNNTNESSITITTLETYSEEYDSKPAAVETIDDSDDDTTVDEPVAKKAKKKVILK